MSQHQVKIGAVLSVTGPASFLGDPEKKTLEIEIKAEDWFMRYAKGGDEVAPGWASR